MKYRLRKIVALLLMLSCALSLLQVCDAQETTASAANDTVKIITDFSVSTMAKGRAKIKFDSAYKIHVDNSSIGRIAVTGWDKDFIEATATSELGDEIIVVRSYDDEGQPVVYIKATADPGSYIERERTIFKEPQFDKQIDNDVTSEKRIDKDKENRKENKEAKKEKQDSPSASSKSSAPAQSSTQPNAPAPVKSEVNSPKTQDFSADNPALSGNPNSISFYKQPLKVNIQVKVPRRAELMPISVIRSDVEVRNIDTPVKVLGAQSTISISNVESAEVRTKSGDVTVENATGLVDLTTTNGSIIVKNAKSDVRILSISGAIDVRCARGRVNISTTAGDITLSGTSSDVEASNTYGAILFTGAIQKDGRYYLKSMSGRVEMKIQNDPPGFLANLSSYRNKVETSFKLKNNETQSGDNHPNSTEQRIKGTYGKGQALITLSSFDREVMLTKTNANELKTCSN